MSRDLAAALTTEITAAVLTPILLVEGLFHSGAVRLWSGIGDITALGHTWNGAGSLLGIGEVEETSQLQANGLTFSLNGIPSTLLSIALAENYQGRTANLYLGALNTSGVLVSDPYLLFSGFMDTMEINEGGETCTIAVAVESKAVILTRAKERRYTHEAQKADYPGDMFFEFVTALQDKEIIWQARPK